jgi:hypothetical protein
VKLLREMSAPEVGPAPDPAWLEGLGQRRAEAEEQWATVVERVNRAVWPDRRQAVLAEELAGLVARFAEPAAAAGGA